MADLGIGAVSSYLSDAGWSRSDQTWNGAAIWSNGTEEVLVPPRDGLGDSAARLKDLLHALGSFENRPAGEIARDIAYPLLDTASYRAPTASPPDGFVPLEAGLGALQGLHDLFRMAAQTVLRSQHFGSEAPVADLLSGVHLGTTTSQQFSVTLLVPLGDESSPAQSPPGRRVLAELYEAALAVRRVVAVGEARPTGIDSLPDSVSPNFCTALTTLASGDESFELGFRWARAIPSQLPDRVVDFPTGSGSLIRELSDHLERELRPAIAANMPPDRSGPVTITGRVEELHDSAAGSDRWRVKIRGAVRTEDGSTSRRVVWVRLAGQDAYDVALFAHRNQHQVQIAGLWTDTAPHRVHIIADLDGLRVVDNP